MSAKKRYDLKDHNLSSGQKWQYPPIFHSDFIAEFPSDVSEGGRCVQTKGTRPPAEVEPLEYTTPTSGCSHDTEREGGSERSTMTSRDRRDA